MCFAVCDQNANRFSIDFFSGHIFPRTTVAKIPDDHSKFRFKIVEGFAYIVADIIQYSNVIALNFEKGKSHYRAEDIAAQQKETR